MPPEDYRLFVGIDWGSQEHQVAIVDPDRTVLHERRVPHTGADVAALTHWLAELAGGAAATVVVALEVPRGQLVAALLAQGCDVYALNPKQLDRFRDRYTVAGVKHRPKVTPIYRLNLSPHRC